jgi:hypothetical protein
MDRITKSLLGDFSTEHEITHLAEDKQFEHFAAYLTVSRTVAESVSSSDLVVGSSGDTGIDAIAIVVNGSFVDEVDSVQELAERNGYLEVTFLFVQAERSSSFETAKIGQFSFGVQDFFSDSPTLSRGADVTRLAKVMTAIYKQSSKFRRGNPTCRLYYVTTGTWTNDQNLEARRKAAISDLVDLRLFKNVDFIPLGSEGIQKFYRESRNAISREFDFSLKAVVPDVAKVTESYLGLLPAPEFLKLIEDDSGEIIRGIFYDNVRDWQDYNSVNSEVRETLTSPSIRSRFALMNNGVTIIAKTLQTTANRFYIEDYQIVNGCQTSHVLHDQREVLDETVMVPLRLIATKDEDVIASIVKATNRQTEVREEQLLALSDFQKKLEAYFLAFDEPQRLYYERRSRQYNNIGHIEKTRVVTPGALIRSFAAMFLEEPHRATRSYKRILDRTGADLFALNHKLEPYYLAALAAYRLEYLFRNQTLDSSLRAARYEILYALRLSVMPKMPPLNSHDMERQCKTIVDVLWETGRSEMAFRRAAALVTRVAGGNLETAPLRTEPFTLAIKQLSAKGSTTAPRPRRRSA